MTSKRQTMIYCDYCPDQTPLIEDHHAGDMICSGCGLVIGDRIIDVGAEWRKFSNEQQNNINKSRVGSFNNELFDSINLSTFISTKSNYKNNKNDLNSLLFNKKSDNNNCSNDNDSLIEDKLNNNDINENFYRRHRYNNKYYNKKYLTNNQRSIISGFKDIAEMGEKLQTIRPVIENAQLLFKKMKEKLNIFKSYNIQIPLASACLYVAYRNQNIPRTFKEICSISNAKKRDIAKCFKIISKEIGQTISQASYVDYIPRFIANLGLTNKMEKITKDYLLKIEKILSGRNPCTIVSLAILFAIISNSNNNLYHQYNNNNDNNLQQQKQLSNEIINIDVCKCCPKTLSQTIHHISKVTGAAETTIKEVYHLVKNQKKFSELFQEVFNSLEI